MNRPAFSSFSLMLSLIIILALDDTTSQGLWCSAPWRPGFAMYMQYFKFYFKQQQHRLLLLLLFKLELRWISDPSGKAPKNSVS